MIRLLAALTAGATLTAGSWGVAPALPTPRSAHAVVAVAGAVYVLGGPGSATVARFDGRGWTTLTRLPGGIVNAPAAVALGGRIYVLGGFNGATNSPTARVSVFDTSAKKWSSAPALPGPRGGTAAVVLKGKIHVLGGGNDVSTLASHSVYDPVTRTWTEAAPLPRPEGSVAAVVLGGRIYVVGGRSGFDDYGDTFVYDSGSDRWSSGPRVPPRGTAGAAVWRGSIYLFGGESQPRASVLSDVYRLAWGASRWRRVGRMPTARSYARTVVFHGRIYVVGGSTVAGSAHSSTGSRVVEVFAP